MPSPPKPHRQRQDGWTPERVQLFLACLGHTGCVRDACRVADISSTSAYRHRRRDADFADAWEKALARSRAGLVAVAYQRAVEGRETVIYRKGEEVERRVSPSDAMLALLLKRGDLSGENEGVGGAHADLAGVPREEILTREEWLHNIRFDEADGGKTVEPDRRTTDDSMHEGAEKLRRGLRLMAERGEECPCCNQTLPPDWPQCSLMALDTLGVIRMEEVAAAAVLTGIAESCAAIEAAGLTVPRCPPVDLLAWLAERGADAA